MQCGVISAVIEVHTQAELLHFDAHYKLHLEYSVPDYVGLAGDGEYQPETFLHLHFIH